MDNNFAKNLKFLRIGKGLVLKEIPDYSGFSSSQWNNWELGISFPNFLDFLKISELFSIPETDLVRLDLSKGNLILKQKKGKNTQIGNLNGNPLGNLNPINEPSEVYKISSGKGVLPAVVTVDSGGNDNIVHVPVKARAGYLTGYGDPTYIETLYSYRLPGMRSGTYRSFEVEGLSMKPVLNHSDWVIGSWVESLEQIRENRVHIIVTRNDGVLIKRVLNRVEKRGKLYLKSDTISNRADYPIIELDPSEVAEIWYANIKFSSDFSEPSEIFTRLNDLEIDVLELKKANKKH